MTDERVNVQDASPTEAYDAVKERRGVVVDVRTTAEWAYVGLPLLEGAEPLLLEWQTFPTMAVDSGFAEALEAACPDRDTPLYFLCRSGVRSHAAATLMGGRGYRNVYNVVGGFEGPPDADGHRGRVVGWKAEGLPWRQS